MAFWENVGKSVSSAAATAAQKTKDMTEIGTLMAKVAQETRNRDAAYLELGRQYASLHREDYDEAFAGAMQRIAACDQSIRASEQRIQILKGARVCPNCGTPASGDTRFCTVCGTRLESGPPRSVCTGCGAVLDDGAAFCPACGTPVGSQSTPPQNGTPQSSAAAGSAAETVQSCAPANGSSADSTAEDTLPAEPPALPPAAETPSAVCPRCGYSNEAESAFCVSCGQRLIS